jgi:hypothetical protein
MPPTTPQIWADPGWDTNAPAAPTSVFAAAPPADAPPVLAKIGMGGAPPVFDSGPMPQVTKQPSPIEQQYAATGQQLQDLQKHDTYDYAEHGKMRNFGHIASKVGNVLGDIFAPSTMAMVPGTDLNRKVQEGSLSSRLQALAQEQSENESRDAGTASTKQKTAAMPQEQADEHASGGARTRLANDQAAALENPTSVPLAQLHANAVNKAIKEGRDPSEDPTVQHLADAITSLQKDPAAQGVGKTTDLKGPDGKVHTMGFDQKTNKFDVDNGESGFKPPVVNVNAGQGRLDTEAKQFGAPHEKSLEAANGQLEKIADARAMINGNAEAQGLGVPKVLTALVGGQGTGVRITQAELTAIAHARGISGDVEGTLNSWAGKGALSKDQQKQLTGIMDDVAGRLREKQTIASGALDTINGATSREQIIAADKDTRQKLNDFEQHGHYAGQTVKLKNGQSVVVQHVHPDGSFD